MPVSGFCKKCLDKAQFLDRHLESAQLMTQLGVLLSESGVHNRSEELLRKALELFWRELKGVQQQMARCYAALGGALLRAGKLQEANVQLQQALEAEVSTG